MTSDPSPLATVIDTHTPASASPGPAHGASDAAGAAQGSPPANGNGSVQLESIVSVVANSMPGMVGYWDQHLRCRFANVQYQEWFGKTEQQMLGISMQEMQGTVLFQKNEPYVRAALAGNEQSFERLLIKPSGEAGWVWARYVPHRVNGQVVGFVALVLDINQRKRVEETLQVAQQRLVNAQSVANVGSWETDLSNFQVIWSAQTYKIFELDPTTFQASHGAFLEFVHPDDKARVDAAFARSFDTTAENSIDHRVITGNGTTKYVEERWRIVRNAQGAPVRALGTCQDITARQTEVEAKSRADKRLALAVTAGRVGIWEWDIPNNKLVWDDAMYGLYGLTEEQFGSAYEAWLAGVHPDDRARGDDEIQSAVRGDQPFDTQFRVIWPGGQVRHIRAIAAVQRDADGQALYMIGTNWDITDQIRIEDDLHQSIRDKDALLKEVHHRVKNNLQVIASLLRLESGRSTIADTRNVLGDMQKRIRAMAMMHESLYRSGTFASIDLGSYLHQLASQLFRTHTLADVRLQVETDSVHVGMDQATPIGLLANELLTNALKHAFPEGRKGNVHLTLHAQDDGAHWRLCISDDGVGLSEDFAQRRQSSLGLQLVGDLASQVGGSLEIGPGATFSVVFKPEKVMAPEVR